MFFLSQPRCTIPQAIAHSPDDTASHNANSGSIMTIANSLALVFFPGELGLVSYRHEQSTINIVLDTTL